MNRLASEKSPYLLQHKDNPVDWYPWGPEAFAKAKAEDKPILLSIGYSTCHWCHVMEHESFSVPAVAEVMNRNFVCVKLDREERPDVDKVYMTAVQALTGQGGWPLNAFLTPDLKPFYGGTYFPPDSRWGRPGWPQLLERLASLWRERRPDIEKDAASLARSVAGYATGAAPESRAVPPASALAAAESALRAGYDTEDGGFGGAPKFPMPANLRFLLRRPSGMETPSAHDMAVETLRKMTRGGIFDQLGGGYSRYSTDGAWRIPHFEKMLYDNGQLLECLADAVEKTNDPELRRALDRTIEYLARDLKAPGGAFFSAEDADSLPEDSPDGHKREGAFYLWEKSELDRLLGKDAAAFAARYGVVEGTNAIADPHGEFVGKCVLYDADPSAMSEAAASEARAKLLARRARRPRPSLDDKVLTSWNGLAIAGLSRAHAVTGDPRPLELARGAAAFVRKELSEHGGKTLWRRWRDGDRKVAGMADDYANMAWGLLELHAASFDPEPLAWAADLAEAAVARFSAVGGGVHMTAVGEGSELFARSIEDHDGVEPAPSSVLSEACLRLFSLTGRPGLRAFARGTLERFAPQLAERPLGLPFLLVALERALGADRSLILAGVDLPGGAELVAAARARFRPSLVVAGFRRADKEAFARVVPHAEGMVVDARARAYLCESGACGVPVVDPAELRRRLDS